MTPWLKSPRTQWFGRLLAIGVVASTLFSLLAVQISTVPPAAEASPMTTVTASENSSTLRAVNTTPATPVPTRTSVVQREEIEPRAAYRPVRPTPTAEAVVFPAPLLPPTADLVKRAATVPILMYHYISTPPKATDKIRVGLSVTPENFEAQLDLLTAKGYTTISLFDLYQHLATGQALPDKPIILTFDDGYVDNYENAFPALKARGMSATFFVLTAPTDNLDPAYMSWTQIKEMSDAGMDMQLHAKDHVDLRHRDYDYLVWEIIGGRQSIEGHTGKPVVFMAYPSGKYDAAVLKFLDNNNFWAAVTTESGKTHTLSDRLTWTRLRIAGQLTLNGFAKLLGVQ
ncbi:MAG: polysaccharide deacetylase family protein [Anaerolineae bacterium]